MKYILFLLVLISLVACNPVGYQRVDAVDWFCVRRDTVYFEANSSLDSCDLRDLYSVCKCKGKYYLEFGVYGDWPRIFSLSEDFRTLKKLPYPKEFFHYEDLFVRNDSVFSKSEGWPTTWTRYFDEKRQQWQDYSERQDKFHYSEQFYEDETYYVSYLPLIDGVGNLIFKEKATGVEHTYHTFSFAQFLKHNVCYYSIGNYGIYRIKDPRRDLLRDSMEVTNHFLLGEVLMHMDNDWGYGVRPDTTLLSALVVQDTIYVLTNDSKGIYFNKIENDTIKKSLDISGNLHAIGCQGVYLHVAPQNQIIEPFYWKSDDGEENSGILDIQGYDIHLIYFVKRPS